MEQALTKKETISAIEKKFQEAEKVGHLLTPITKIDYLPPMHSISVRFVKLNETDVYQSDDFSKNERAPSKEGLMKIAAAAGIDWIDAYRKDDMSDPYYCNMHVKGVMQDFDGKFRMIMGSKEVDLRKGSAQTKGWSDKRLDRARQHIQQLAETKAMERAIRKALSIKQKYTLEELKKPFVIPKLVFIPDETDPDVKKALIEHSLSAKSKLFGSPEPEHIHGKVIDIQKIENSTPEKEPDNKPFEEEETQEMERPSEDNDDLTCSCSCGCNNNLSEKVVTFSMKEYGEPLCMHCQPGQKYYDVKKHKK